MKRLILCGHAGRMGRLITKYAGEYGFETVAGIDQRPAAVSFPQFSAPGECTVSADLFMDFSSASLLPQTLTFLNARRIPAVIAVTGCSALQTAAIQETAKQIPLFYSCNFSFGATLLSLFTETAAALMPDFDIEIIEMHHRAKADAPSGTALMLFDAAKRARKEAFPLFGRSGRAERNRREIGIHAVRGGTLAGEHSILLTGNRETFTMTHTAQDAEIFARGALDAARYVIEKPPGFYTMRSRLEEQLRGPWKNFDKAFT